MARHMAVSESNNYATMPVSYKAHKHEGSSNDSSEHLQQSEKLINDTYYPTITQSHCAFSSNLFHRHIVQKGIDQISPPKKQKMKPWKIFWNKTTLKPRYF